MASEPSTMSESPPAALLPGWLQALPSGAVLLAVALLWHGLLQSLPDERTLGLSLLLGLLPGSALLADYIEQLSVI
ncbi:hypothetical protein, partial [Escherichia coli]|uniref:hypothetical protein n=1 Tax=Escherichia coli TaxID=562 RepID=UPI00129060D0